MIQFHFRFLESNRRESRTNNISMSQQLEQIINGSHGYLEMEAEGNILKVSQHFCRANFRFINNAV